MTSMQGIHGVMWHGWMSFVWRSLNVLRMVGELLTVESKTPSLVMFIEIQTNLFFGWRIKFFRR